MIGSFSSALVTTPKHSVGVCTHISNFRHDTHLAKKAQKSDKENDNSQASASLSQPIPCNMFGMSLPQPPLDLTNGQNIRIHNPRPYIEEVEDDDREPAIDPLPFDADGPIIIEVMPSVAGSGLDIGDNGEYEADCDRLREEMEEENSGNGQPTSSDSEDEVL